MTKTAERDRETAREIFDAVHAMEPGLTINDRVVFIASHLAAAREDGRREERALWQKNMAPI